MSSPRHFSEPCIFAAFVILHNKPTVTFKVVRCLQLLTWTFVRHSLLFAGQHLCREALSTRSFTDHSVCPVISSIIRILVQQFPSAVPFLVINNRLITLTAASALCCLSRRIYIASSLSSARLADFLILLMCVFAKLIVASGGGLRDWHVWSNCLDLALCPDFHFYGSGLADISSCHGNQRYC